MRIAHPVFRRHQSGYGLIIVMAFLVVLLLIFASLMRWSASNSQITLRNNLFNQSENAAESATENIMARLMRDYYYGPLGAASSYNTNFPATNGWPVYFQFSDTNLNTACAATVTFGSQASATNLVGAYSGLYGFVVPCTVASTAKPLGQGVDLSATVAQYIQFAQIPLFQFAIFYNMDLEINPGAGMNISGAVHSNGSIWATGSGSGSSLLVFSNTVQAAGAVTLTRSTNDPSYSSTPSPNVLFKVTQNNPLMNANILSLPVGVTGGNNSPTNVSAILALPPAAYAPTSTSDEHDAAYSGNGTNYLRNESDLIISNSIAGTNGTGGTNIWVYYQNPKNNPTVIPVLPDVPVIYTNRVGGVWKTNVSYVCYSFVTNAAFYDYRESDTVQAVQIDVAALNKWLTNTFYVKGTNKITGTLSGTTITVTVALNGTNTVLWMLGTNLTSQVIANPIANLFNTGGQQYGDLKTAGGTQISTYGVNSIYVYSSVPLSGTALPAVRMVNGQRLPPSGLTIATPLPIYVKGDYNVTTDGTHFSKALGNTTYTYPAALMGDAVTILSTNWLDSYNTSTNLNSRNPTTNVINAATLEGIVPSNGTYYSGGVENFLRLLENWSSSTPLIYNGSIIVMFPSQYATNHWITTGTYYNAPKRLWGFDTKFNDVNNLPPLTPQIKASVRGGWSAW